MTERFTGGHGQLALGVCYYPEHWPATDWAEDAAQMAALGLRYVRIGEFAWSRIEPRPGEFDWAWLDEAVETLGKAGLGVIMGTPTACPPVWLINEHPDILAVGECVEHGGALFGLVAPLYEQAKVAAETLGMEVTSKLGLTTTTRDWLPHAQKESRCCWTSRAGLA